VSSSNPSYMARFWANHVNNFGNLESPSIHSSKTRLSRAS
jgi:hypothetical protein